jgi:hypothetical protein
MVTGFKIEGKTTTEVITALREYLKACEVAGGDYDFCDCSQWAKVPAKVPDIFRWLIAYAVEGESEGWYVHIGVLVSSDCGRMPLDGLSRYTYEDWGFAKTWTADSAYAIAREAQRFLSAARWG